MITRRIKFTHQSTAYYFNASFSALKDLVAQKKTVVITDENIFSVHGKRFKGWNTIVLKAGEEYKIQPTVDSVIAQLIELKADRGWTLVGVGGGVITDLTGYIASVYLRGIAFGFVPTTVLAMVDAAIGGKNGIDVGMYKNMVGVIRQPQFLLYDTSFLKTLLDAEWCNGFAEIIKHAAIKDGPMFKELEEASIGYFQKKAPFLQKLIQRNALLKSKVVQGDEFEQNQRRLLNFGHTLGHALENQYQLMHGEAVAIGMCFAARLSGELLGFKGAERLIHLIDRYGLPIHADYDKAKVFEVLSSDKKKEDGSVNFILLQRIGKGVVEKISLDQLRKFL
jgi:3-dehydroquinate synthase